MDDNTRRLTIFSATAFCTVLIAATSMIWAVGHHRRMVLHDVHPAVATESPDIQPISADRGL
jgi:hypothetical protein